MKLYYTVAHTPKEAQVDTILFFVGTEATDRWKTLREQMSAEDQASPDKVFEAFANSFEKSSSYWQAREEYLSDIKQNKQQTTAELDIYIKDLVRRCQFKRAEIEARKIDLLYHATVHFEVRKFVHNAKPEELTYDRMIEVAKAHERTCHEYQQHKQAHSVPVSYQNPLIQTNAVRKSFQKPRTCGKCGRSHPQGQCPAHGQTCHSCGRKGHWTQMCRTRQNSSTGRTPSPHPPPNKQRRPSGDKPFKQQGGGGGKPKFFKKGGTPNKFKKGGTPPQKTHSLKLVTAWEEKTVSNSVGVSGPAHPPKEKYSLSAKTGKQRANPFTCYALGNGNGSQVDDSNKKYKVYTDTDSDGKTEIITDINCKFKGKLFAMEVKVDPGSETNCIPLSHFRHLFPQLCKTDGLPKETALEPTLAQFEAYDGGIMQAHGWTIMPTQNISTKKFHPVRYYVVEREDARILISHATASWLDLMRVLCTNKAPKCKRQVASVTKKLKEPPRKNSHFRTSTPSQREIFSETTSSQSEIYHGATHNNKTVTKRPTSAKEANATCHNFGRRRRSRRRTHKEVVRSVELTAVQRQASTSSCQQDRAGQSQPTALLTGPTHPPKEKYSLRTASHNNHNNRFAAHFRTSTPSQSEIFSNTPERLYYQPQEDQETFTINAEGHLQSNQDSNKVIKANTPQDLPGSREYPIYHKPGSIPINSVEDLIRLYPNSFDRLGSLKGAYDIKVDPTVPPVQHARRKVPIESKQAIEEAIDYMVSEGILEQQIEPTPWVSSVTYPVKPSGEVRPCLDARDLNRAIIRENHKPQTVEEIAHQLAGATVFTKADTLKAFLQVHLTEESSKLLVINTHKGRYRFKRMPFGAKMSQDVFQMKMDIIMEKCPGVISIHDDIVIYGTSNQDHDANLINLLNVAQLEGLVLNSKKLELKRPKVSFFGAEYSIDGMHPCPKKIQGSQR